jgi:hypothetical protein
MLVCHHLLIGGRAAGILYHREFVAPAESEERYLDCSGELRFGAKLSCRDLNPQADPHHTQR